MQERGKPTRAPPPDVMLLTLRERGTGSPAHSQIQGVPGLAGLVEPSEVLGAAMEDRLCGTRPRHLEVPFLSWQIRT